MRRLVSAFCLLAVTTQAGVARGATFPYEAIVDAKETYVRSGPGSKYYPTGKLQAGQRVTVHRHDPGGWHMIAPPPGSFSWIKAQYVERADGSRGVVKSNNVVVRVGSFESDIRDLFQRHLSQGDEVKILGEKMLVPETGSGAPELWYRIEPPRGEWRWIAGQAVTAAGAAAVPPARSAGSDPFESPTPAASAPVEEPSGDRSHAVPAPPEAATARDHEYLDERAVTGKEGTLGERPLRRSAKAGDSTPVPKSRADKQEEADWEELSRLDARLRAILKQETLHWDFNELEPDYRRLANATTSLALQKTVESRFVSIDRFRRERAELEAEAHAADETLRRDAELQELQRRHEAQFTRLSQSRTTPPRFDGAGIVERAAGKPGTGPRYVLLAPEGRVLAYLQPAPGVNLEQWVRRPAGVVGTRSFRPELKADLIVVKGLTPVRLGP